MVAPIATPPEIVISAIALIPLPVIAVSAIPVNV